MLRPAVLAAFGCCVWLTGDWPSLQGSLLLRQCTGLAGEQGLIGCIAAHKRHADPSASIKATADANRGMLLPGIPLALPGIDLQGASSPS